MVHNLAHWMRRALQAWLRLILHEQARWEEDTQPRTRAPRPKPEVAPPQPRSDEPTLTDLIEARMRESRHRAPRRDEDQ